MSPLVPVSSAGGGGSAVARIGSGSRGRGAVASAASQSGPEGLGEEPVSLPSPGALAPWEAFPPPEALTNETSVRSFKAVFARSLSRAGATEFLPRPAPRASKGGPNSGLIDETPPGVAGLLRKRTSLEGLIRGSEKSRWSLFRLENIRGPGRVAHLVRAPPHTQRLRGPSRVGAHTRSNP